MGNTTKITPDYLTDLKGQVNKLLTDIRGNSDLALLAEWSPVGLGDPSTWDSGTSASISTSGSGGGTAAYKVLPGSTNFVPAATLQQRSTQYVGSVVNAVNWITEVLQSLSDNIDSTLTKFASTEHDAEIDARQLYGQLQTTFGDVGGAALPTSTITL